VFFDEKSTQYKLGIVIEQAFYAGFWIDSKYNGGTHYFHPLGPSP